MSRSAELRRFLIRTFLNLSTVFKFDCFKDYCVKESRLCIVFRMATNRKHNELTLERKYEPLKKLDKNGPKKEVATQFNVPETSLATLKKTRKKSTKFFKIHN